MRNKWFKRLFPLFALLILAPWPVAYAHTLTDDTADQEVIQIEAADTLEAPSLGHAGGGTFGGVTTPGALFYIDATENTHDIQANLYITNTNELSRRCRNLILKVGIYVENGAGEWEEAALFNGEAIPDTFITMRDAQVSFTLAGLAKYKVTIDSGSFYCISGVADGGSLSPNFYLTVD